MRASFLKMKFLILNEFESQVNFLPIQNLFFIQLIMNDSIFQLNQKCEFEFRMDSILK